MDEVIRLGSPLVVKALHSLHNFTGRSARKAEALPLHQAADVALPGLVAEDAAGLPPAKGPLHPEHDHPAVVQPAETLRPLTEPETSREIVNAQEHARGYGCAVL